MGAMVSMASFAQEEEDVTNLIQNAGFDEDLTWQADGSKKEIVENVDFGDGRSSAGVAADGSLYMLPKASSGQNRKDGRKLEATNGFKGVIKGWTTDLPENKNCNWTYVGSVPYSLGETAIPVADDGDTYFVVPSTKPEGAEGEDNIGTLYLRAGWGNKATYSQVVKLPCAKYRIEYWTINVNPNASKTATDLSQIICRNDVFKEDGSSLSSTEWTKHEFEFTPTAEFTLQFGIQSEGGAGSGAQQFICIDGIKLYKIDEADRYDIFSSELYELQQEAASEELMPLVLCMDEYMTTMEDLLDKDPEGAVPVIEKRLAEFREAIAEAKSLNSLLKKMDYVLKTTENYPGKEAFEAAIARIGGYVTGQGEEGADVVAQILGAPAEAKEAMKAYFLSKVDAATPEDPADLTIFVKNPWFINEDAEPMLKEEIWEFPKQFSEEGEDLYKEGSKDSPDLNSEGWYVAGISGGDQRLNWQRGRSCWNAWNNDFTGAVAVAQDLEGLPNGYYTVSADLITQGATDQHVFLKSVADRKQSAEVLTVAGWDESLWTTIGMKAEEKVLVVNGKLTIGAEGTGTGSGSAGWFCATNFKLNFVGKASQEEIDKAINDYFDTTVKAATACADTMHFKADKKALLDTVALYKDAEKIAAIEKINAAIEEAKKSEAKYYDYVPVNPTDEVIKEKTLLWVKALLDGQAVEGKITLDASKDIVKFAYDYVQTWIKCDTAAYTKFDAVVDLLKNYVNTYAPVCEDANAQLKAMKSEVAKKELKAVMDEQKANLTAAMNTKEQVDDNVTALKAVMNATNKQEIFENNKEAEDFTVFIQNPNLEAEAGWTFDKGNGNTNTTSSQWLDGSDTRYIDSYNSSGLSGYIASQLVTGLPNGTYTVGLYARTPAEGAYIFTSVAEADTAFVEIPLSYHNPVNDNTGDYAGQDTLLVASDKWGLVWEEANAIIADEARYEALSDAMKAYYQTIAEANNSDGRGWRHMEIANVVVTNHELLIGTKTGSGIEGSKTPKAFKGAWYSVGGWTLTRTVKGDDGDWTGPITGIQNVETVKQVADGIYTLTGVKANQLQRGLNIVVRNGKALKIMVK